MSQTDYNSIHTGPRIDEAISRALPGGAIDLALSSKPNPNLIDNWYFGNPVNQRGQTSYTGTSYGIDRWHGSGLTSITLESDRVLLIKRGNGIPVIDTNRGKGRFVNGY